MPPKKALHSSLRRTMESMRAQDDDDCIILEPHEVFGHRKNTGFSKKVSTKTGKSNRKTSGRASSKGRSSSRASSKGRSSGRASSKGRSSGPASAKGRNSVPVSAKVQSFRPGSAKGQSSRPVSAKVQSFRTGSAKNQRPAPANNRSSGAASAKGRSSQAVSKVTAQKSKVTAQKPPPKSPKPKVIVPPVMKFVEQAICNLDDSKGSSLEEILDYFINRYPVDDSEYEMFKCQIMRALKEGVQIGWLLHVHDGHKACMCTPETDVLIEGRFKIHHVSPQMSASKSGSRSMVRSPSFESVSKDSRPPSKTQSDRYSASLKDQTEDGRHQYSSRPQSARQSMSPLIALGMPTKLQSSKATTALSARTPSPRRSHVSGRASVPGRMETEMGISHRPMSPGKLPDYKSPVPSKTSVCKTSSNTSVWLPATGSSSTNTLAVSRSLSRTLALNRTPSLKGQAIVTLGSNPNVVKTKDGGIWTEKHGKKIACLQRRLEASRRLFEASKARSDAKKAADEAAGAMAYKSNPADAKKDKSSKNESSAQLYMAAKERALQMARNPRSARSNC